MINLSAYLCVLSIAIMWGSGVFLLATPSPRKAAELLFLFGCGLLIGSLVSLSICAILGVI